MNLQRILVANDFSPSSAAALELAADLARRFHARIEVLHVFDQSLPPFGDPMLPAAGEPDRTFAELVHEKTSVQMHRCVRSLQRRGLAAAGQVAIGDPAQVILASAADYDLVVMGTHGRTGLSRLVNGSVAEQVVRHAPCPVLTARGETAHEEVAHGG